MCMQKSRHAKSQILENKKINCNVNYMLKIGPTLVPLRMKKRTMKYAGDFVTFLKRILLLYAVFMLCRILFYVFNATLIGPLDPHALPRMVIGALVFDSVSIFYLNIPFLVASLVPFRFRSRDGYQRFLLWLFVVVNSLAMMLAVADIFYYPFKLARITLEEFHFAGYGNFGSLMAGFLAEYWYGVAIWAALCWLLWRGFRAIRYRATQIRSNWIYYTSQTGLLAGSVALAIILIRGGVSAAAFPINVNDVTMYAPADKASLVLSNPFALIRTAKVKLRVPEYFPQEVAGSLFSPEHPAPGPSRYDVGERPNIVLIILESFGTAHIKSLSDRFPADAPSLTPFLDSLIGQGLIFRNAYDNGKRSLDALPSIWASIPSLEEQFLTMPQSVGRFEALPSILDSMGYSTAFLHGAVRESMSFVSFGKAVGVGHFVSREDYESEHGTGDFDGKWGIWDHKFLPFAAGRLNTLAQPFFATFFTLSSHHPFRLPPGFSGRYPEGTQEIHRMIAYSDDALRVMFGQMSHEEWFANTLFIITADHTSGADNEKYLHFPYNHNVPILFYHPGGALRGEDFALARHIDIMPTVLGLLRYGKPYFAFGRDLLGGEKRDYMVSYTEGGYKIVKDSLLYLFDGREVTGIYDYRNDPTDKTNLLDTMPPADSVLDRPKAFIQQYYTRLRDRNYRAAE